MRESYQMPRAEDEQEVKHPQVEYCIACKSALPDKAASPHAELCLDCRERFIRYPFPKWLFAMLAVVLALNIATYYWFPQSMQEYAQMKHADDLFAQKHYLLASREYAVLVQTTGKSGKLIEKQLDACMACGDLATAGELIDNNYVGKDVSDELYNKLTGYDVVFQRLEKGYQLLDELYTEGMPEQEYLDKLTKKIGNADTDPMVQQQMAYAYQALGDEDKAMAQIDQVIAKGDPYLGGYTTKAAILRRQGDFTAAEAACRKALEANLDDVEAHRQLAVLYMLRKEYKAAVKEARTAYELEPEFSYVREVYAYSCHLSGDAKTRDAVLAEMKKANDPTAETVDQMIAGQTTVENIYME